MRVIDLLCSACRRIHPVDSDGGKDKNCLEEIFGGYEFQLSDPLITGTVLPTLRENLLLSGGCSGCIASVERVAK